MVVVKCKIGGCEAHVYAKGFCKRCYGREYARRQVASKQEQANSPSGATKPVAARDRRAAKAERQPAKPRATRPRLGLALNGSPRASKTAQTGSVLSLAIWRAIDRTRISRHLLDLIIAQDAPDPVYDSLEVVLFGKPSRFAAATLAETDQAESGAEPIGGRKQRAPTKWRCRYCHTEGHTTRQCKTRLRDAARRAESSNVTATIG